MAHLIDKDPLIAELERRRDAALMRQRNLKAIGQESVINEMVANELNKIISSINHLEVKEVDLEKELDSMITPELKFHKALPPLFDIAKHFFELGMQVINKAQKGE